MYSSMLEMYVHQPVPPNGQCVLLLHNCDIVFLLLDMYVCTTVALLNVQQDYHVKRVRIFPQQECYRGHPLGLQCEQSHTTHAGDASKMWWF